MCAEEAEADADADTESEADAEADADDVDEESSWACLRIANFGDNDDADSASNRFLRAATPAEKMTTERDTREHIKIDQQ